MFRPQGMEHTLFYSVFLLTDKDEYDIVLLS